MISTHLGSGSLLGDAAWQTTLFLLLGLLGSFLWARQPARAHRFLALMMAAALLTPLLSQGTRLLGWGLFAGSHPAVAAEAPVALAESEPPRPVRDQVLPPAETGRAQTPVRPAVVELRTADRAQLSEPAADPEQIPPAPASALPVLLTAWGIVSGLFLLHLLHCLVQGWRLLARATPLTDPQLEQALQAARARLGLGRAPALLTSEQVVSPLIWCWARRPVLLLPAAAARPDSGVDWVSVLCHELAHWKRRDHLTGLLAELGVALLPLQPLAWGGGADSASCVSWPATIGCWPAVSRRWAMRNRCWACCRSAGRRSA
jgi:Zn-dependent protease with chaperone function